MGSFVAGNLRKHRHFRDNLTGYLFILPALLTFLVFIGGPIVASVFFLDFCKYNILTPPVYVGLRNFLKLFSDPMSSTVFLNTFKFVAILVPLHVVIGLLLALGVCRKIASPLKYYYRTAIYFPVVVTVSAVTIIWTYFFNFDFGVINYFLNLVGIQSVPWLKSGDWALVAVAIFSVWKGVGSSFIFFVIGLQNIPDSYMEAAKIDGANWFHLFFKIKLPLLTPTMFLVLTTILINCFQIFDEPFLITNGGPGTSTRTIALQIYEQAFRSYDMGYASSFAAVLFAIVLAITVIQFSFQKKWVNYDYE